MSTTTKHHIPPWAKDESCLHNPDKLTAEQVGKGYRLLLPSEVTGKHEHVADSWDKFSKIWDGPNGVFACFSSITYRVPLTVPWPPPPSEGPKTDGFEDWANNQFVGSQIWWKEKFRHCWQSAIAQHKADMKTMDEKPSVTKFKVGDQVRLLNGGTIGTIQEVIRDKMYQHTQMYDVLWDGVNIAGDHPEYELELFEWKTSEQPTQRLEDQLASLKSHLVTAELERDKLQSWKDQMLTVESWWSKVDEFIRNHPKAPMGQNVSDIALQWLRAYMEEKSKP